MLGPPARGALAALACGALAGCTLITDSFETNDFSGDPFPIHVGRETGAVMIGVREPGGPAREAVLDVLSPVTVVDPGPDARPSIGSSDLTLLGRRTPASEAFDLPRAKLRDGTVISLHPCADRACAVGPSGAQRAYGAIIGANVLAGDALRLRLGDDQVFVLADVGGDNRDRTFVCDAVFPSPYRGGGTMIIADTEVSFGGRRVMMQACLGARPEPDLIDPATEEMRAIPQSARGANALLVMSTGIGVSLLGEAAYVRYQQARAGDPEPPPALDALPSATVFLPSGPVVGRAGAIDRIALAAASSSSSRAPCRQAHAHRWLLHPASDRARVQQLCREAEDCPCPSGAEFCPAPAVVELAPATGIPVLVVPDSNATLQALRAELRPDQPEVDGLLGADALALAEIDIDYPHNRVLMRCTSPSPDCLARPALAAEADRTQIRNCILRAER